MLCVGYEQNVRYRLWKTYTVKDGIAGDNVRLLLVCRNRGNLGTRCDVSRLESPIFPWELIFPFGIFTANGQFGIFSVDNKQVVRYNSGKLKLLKATDMT